MKDFLERYKVKYYSKNGEEGIVDECFKRMNVTSGEYCEISYNQEDTYNSNVYFLSDKNFSGLFIERNTPFISKLIQLTSNKNITVLFGTVTKRNINDLVAHLKDDFDLLSINVNSYQIWNALIKKPKIVIVDINNSAPVDDIILDSPLYGTSYEPMVILGRNKGYFLLCHTTQLMFIDIKYRYLFPELDGYDSLEHSNLYFNQ